MRLLKALSAILMLAMAVLPGVSCSNETTTLNIFAAAEGKAIFAEHSYITDEEEVEKYR
jgi:hypothetical protein